MATAVTVLNGLIDAMPEQVKPAFQPALTQISAMLAELEKQVVQSQSNLVAHAAANETDKSQLELRIDALEKNAVPKNDIEAMKAQIDSYAVKVDVAFTLTGVH